jgi:hypothetical protein
VHQQKSLTLTGKFILCVVFALSHGHSFSQKDSIKIQNIQGVNVSATAVQEIVYSEFDSYVMDIEYVQGRFFILMRSLFRHHLVMLDAHMHPIDKISLDFHPTELFESCAHDVVLLAKDSMYTMGIDQDKLVLDYSDSKASYFTFYKDCMGSVGSNYYMKQIRDLGNSTYYFNVDVDKKFKKCIYSVVDSNLRRSDQEELSQLGVASSSAAYGNIKYKQLRKFNAGGDDAIFFKNIKRQGAYHPLFVYEDSLYIFDHQKNVGVRMNHAGSEQSRFALTDSLCKLWNDKIYMDEDTGSFYAVKSDKGMYTFMRISKDGAIEKSVVIKDHIYLENILISNHYVYFTAKVSVDDNLNKIFRQRL